MLVRVKDLTKSFGGNFVLEKANFEIKRGDKIALIGENGSGKTTLLRIVAGLLDYDSGTLTIAQGISIGYLEQEIHPENDETVLEFALKAIPQIYRLQRRLRSLEENLSNANHTSVEFESLLNDYGKTQAEFEGLEGYNYQNKVVSILHNLGFTQEEQNRPLATFSGGEKKVVGLARLLIQHPDVLLLDEPDNHLDIQSKQWLEDFIRSYDGAVCVISHDRYFLNHFINHIFEIEDRHVYEYYCNYSGFLEAKRRRLEKEAMLYRMKQRQLRQLKKSAERLAQWAALNNKFAGRARNRKRMLEKHRQEIENTVRPVVDRSTIKLRFEHEESSRKVLEIRNLSMSYGERILFEPFDLTIRHGERVGLVGPNGSGKTTLFKIILGEETPTSGEVRLGPRVKVGYYSQEQESLDPNVTPIEYIRYIKPMREEQAIAFLRSHLLFEYEVCRNKIANLSGGQKSRLQLAGMALAGVNFLLLDEPTNNLDIPSMIVLESALLDFKGTIFVISHDRYFLDQIVDRIVAVQGHKVRSYIGNFSEFYEKVGGKVDIGLGKRRHT